MHFNFLKAGALLAILTPFSGATDLDDGQLEARQLGRQPLPLTRCFTAVGTSSLASVSTSYSTTQTSCTLLSYSIISASATVTARARTAFFTTTVPTTIAGPVNTGTLTSTLTVPTTTTIVSSSITTVVSTSTFSSTSTITTTIASAVGFLPVQGSYPGASFLAAIRAREALENRSPEPQFGGGRGGRFGFGRGRGFRNQRLYPAAVSCIVYQGVCTTSTRTFTATSTSTIIPAIVSSTVTSISTVVTNALAQTTVTSTVSSIVRVLSVSTVSTTSIVATTVPAQFAALQTFYAACAPSNLVNRNADGTGIADVPNIGDTDTAVTTSDTTAYGCCVSLVTNTRGGIFAFGNDGRCLLVLRDVCLGLDQTTRYRVSAGDPFFTVGNGQCGAIGGLVAT